MKKYIILILIIAVGFSTFAAFKFRGHMVVKALSLVVENAQQSVHFDKPLSSPFYKVILITPGRDIRHFSMKILNKDTSGFDIKLYKDGVSVTGIRIRLYIYYG